MQVQVPAKKHTTPTYSPVVTELITRLAVTGLSRGERTGSRVLALMPMVVCDDMYSSISGCVELQWPGGLIYRHLTMGFLGRSVKV